MVDDVQSSAAGAQSSGVLEAEGAGESEAAPPSAPAPRKRPGAVARRRPKHYSSDSDSDEDDEDWEEEDDAVCALHCAVSSERLCVDTHSTSPPSLSPCCCTGLGPVHCLQAVGCHIRLIGDNA